MKPSQILSKNLLPRTLVYGGTIFGHLSGIVGWSSASGRLGPSHNAEEKARYEREREELLEKLKLSDDKAAKFEKLPRWVAKLFGT